MLDEGLCLVCGSPVNPDVAYCSRECSVADSSSSSHSAPSSGHPSPQLYPTDRPSLEVPGLIYSHRTRPSLSSTSTVDSDEYVYGDMSNINFNRRPGTTNSRGVIPTLGHHRPNNNRRLSANAPDPSYMRFTDEDAPSSYAKTKAWKDAFAITSPSPLPPPSFLDPTSSDDEYPTTDIYLDDSHQKTVTKRTSLKHMHRVSLPAYFSRLAINNSTRSPDARGPADQAQSLPTSKSPKSSPRSRSAYDGPISTSNSTVTGAFKAFTPTAIHPPSSFSHVEAPSTTPRGRGRERNARVRQGASRSPPETRYLSGSISPLVSSPSPPVIPLLDSVEDASRRRGRDSNARVLHADSHAPVMNVPFCGSLGGRILREAQQVQPNVAVVKQPAPIYEKVAEVETVNRGRRTRDEEVEGGDERDRGRSRLVVRRRSENPAPPVL